MQPPRGTRDIFPNEFRKMLKIFGKMRKVAELYGYEPVETPAFENIKVLTAKSGEAIKEQIYYFKDKAGRELGLRFDLTTPIARIVAGNPQIQLPIKWYYISRMWRYEKPKEKGLRYREFWQFGVEYIGVKELYSDAETILTAIKVLNSLGLKDFKVFLSNRKFLEGIVRSFGIKNTSDVIRVIDKKDKLERKEFEDQLIKVGLDRKYLPTVLKLVELNGDPDYVIKRAEDEIKLNELAREGLKEIKEVVGILKKLNVENYIKVDLGIARGLGYYTNTIFETFEIENNKKVGSTLVGGGRYDNLIQILGGKPTPAVGWAMGIERIIQLLKKKNLIPKIEPIPRVIVLPVTSDLLVDAMGISEILRNKGIGVMFYDKLKKGLKIANKRGIPFAVVVGKKEIQNGEVVVKNMKSGKEITCDVGELTGVV